MPSGQVDKPLIEDNRDGTVSVKYEPKEEGLHELVVKYNGENVQGECVCGVERKKFDGGDGVVFSGTVNKATAVARAHVSAASGRQVREYL